MKRERRVRRSEKRESMELHNIGNTCNDDRIRVLKIIKTTNYEYD